MNDHDAAKMITSLDGWHGSWQSVEKTFVLRNFSQAMALVNRVAELAERANHHPDMIIRFNRVTIILTTHEAGQVTAKDLALARAIEGHVKDW